MQMNVASNDTAIKTEYFTMGFFHIHGLYESPQSLLEVGISIIIIPIRRGRLRLKLLSIAHEELGGGHSEWGLSGESSPELPPTSCGSA